MFKKFNRLIAILMTYITVIGLITFSMFIFEEAIQMATFGTWPSQDAKQWKIVLKGTDIIDNINTWLKVVNYSCGWIQPLAFLSYKKYSEATDYYVESVRQKVLALSPESFDKREMTFQFKPQKIVRDDDMKTWAVSGKVWVEIPEKSDILPGQEMEVSGTITVSQGKVLVHLQ